MTVGDLITALFDQHEAGNLRDRPHKLKLYIWDQRASDYIELDGFHLRGDRVIVYTSRTAHAPVGEHGQ